MNERRTIKRSGMNGYGDQKAKKIKRREFIRQFYRGNTLPFIGASIATLLISALNLFISWLLQQMFDSVSGIEGARGLGELTLLTVSIAALIILFKAISYATLPRFMSRAMEQYKNHAFHKLTQKSFTSFYKENTALYLSALSNDANTVEISFLEKQFGLLASAVTFFGAIVMMLFYSPVMTIVAAGFSILPVLASLFAGNKMETAERKVSDCNEGFLASLKDSLSGFSVIKSFQVEKIITELIADQNHVVAQSKCKRRKISIVIGAVGGVAGVTAQLGVFLAGAYLIEAGFEITPGVLIIFVELMVYVIQPIRELPEILAERKAALALIDKLVDALEDNVQDVDGEAISNRLHDGIEIRNLYFSYNQTCSEGMDSKIIDRKSDLCGEKNPGERETEQHVLHNISVKFEAGKSYAIVGASGSGKSTLLNLLMAAHGNYYGEIRFDGKELKGISTKSLYELISIIQQNVFIFNASIRDNITMFCEFPEEAVKEAIRKSGLSELVAQKGEDYLCGENGSGLSGGEKQRISIARSLLRKSTVLLADEATAALDSQTAYQVSDSILELDGITRIVVTHNLDDRLLSRYDSILTLKGGRVIESGSFDELMARKGYFYSLYTVAL